ncbi:MAG: DMT family transporter [Oscillospiraceae bacterium]
MKKGVLAVVGASVLYGIMPVFTKKIMLEGMNSASTVFFRVLLASLFSLIYIKIKGISLKVTKQQLLQLAIFGGFAFGSTAALLTASYSYIPIGLATMLHFTYPLFVTIVMTVVFKERLSPAKVLSCLMAIGGLGLMADFSRLSLVGIVLAVVSGMTYAIYVISNKKGSFASLEGIVVIFYVNGFAALVFGTKAVVTKEFMLPTSGFCVFLLIIVAIFCTIIALLLLTSGVRTLGASNAAVLNMLEPITSVFAGLIFYHEVIGFAGFMGCVLVIMSSIVVATESGKQRVKAKE